MGLADFIESPANAAATAQVLMPENWPENRLALTGPAGAGKTHLVHVLMAQTGAARVTAAALEEAAVPALVTACVVAVEDADRLAEAPDPPGAERALFHLINLAHAEGAALLITGRGGPARWPVRLPDLASRLAALTPAPLAPPDDALLAAVIAKLLADRHLTHDPALPAYLAARIERSFAAAQAVVERLDAASLAERRNLNRRLAGEVLAAMDAAQQVLPLDAGAQNRHQ